MVYHCNNLDTADDSPIVKAMTQNITMLLNRLQGKISQEKDAIEQQHTDTLQLSS